MKKNNIKKIKQLKKIDEELKLLKCYITYYFHLKFIVTKINLNSSKNKYPEFNYLFTCYSELTK